MNLGNALFTTKDVATGELRGVSVDVMRELASRLGVPLEFVVHATPGDVADASGAGTWDVAILAIEQTRAEKIAFTPAMTEIEATYVVHMDSRLQSAGQVDTPGTRISTPGRAGYELYLTRTLRNATLVRTKGVQALQRQEHGVATAPSRLVGRRMRASHRCIGPVGLQLGGGQGTSSRSTPAGDLRAQKPRSPPSQRDPGNPQSRVGTPNCESPVLAVKAEFRCRIPAQVEMSHPVRL
jgi:hypothetical protein